MGKAGDIIEQPNCCLRHVLWPTHRWHSWCPDAYACWPQLPSSGWHPPTSSQGNDRQYQGGIGWWWWDVAPKFKNLPDDKNRLPKVWMEALKEDYQTAAISWSHSKLCSWSLCRLRAKRSCWWGCGLTTRAQSYCASFCCRLFGQ